MDRDEVEVHKNAKRELGQYPAILTSRLVNNIYMASSASGQYAANSVFLLATRAGKMVRYCPPGTARFVPAKKISPKFKRVHESFLSPKLFSAKVKRCFVFSLSLCAKVIKIHINCKITIWKIYEAVCSLKVLQR